MSFQPDPFQNYYSPLEEFKRFLEDQVTQLKAKLETCNSKIITLECQSTYLASLVTKQTKLIDHLEITNRNLREECNELQLRVANHDVEIDQLKISKIPSPKRRFISSVERDNISNSRLDGVDEVKSKTHRINQNGYGKYIIEIMRKSRLVLKEYLENKCRDLMEKDGKKFKLSSFEASLNKNITEYQTLIRRGDYIIINQSSA